MSANKGRKPAAGNDVLGGNTASSGAGGCVSDGHKGSSAAGRDSISQRLSPPSHLGQYGRAEWRRILPKLIGIATNLDYAALVAYCSAYNTMIQADILLNEQGLIIETEKGMIAHPATRIKASASDQVRRYQTEFGLTPLARLRVQPSLPEGDDDDLAKMC